MVIKCKFGSQILAHEALDCRDFSPGASTERNFKFDEVSAVTLLRTLARAQ